MVKCLSSFLGMEHYTLYVKVKASWQRAWRKSKEVHYSGKNPKWASKNMKHLQSYFYPGPEDEGTKKPTFYFQVWESRENKGSDGSMKGDRKICSGSIPIADVLDCQMLSREEEGFEELQVPMERAYEDGVDDSYLVVSFGFHPYRPDELYNHPVGNDMLYVNVKSVTELMTESGLLTSSDVSFVTSFCFVAQRASPANIVRAYTTHPQQPPDLHQDPRAMAGTSCGHAHRGGRGHRGHL